MWHVPLRASGCALSASGEVLRREPAQGADRYTNPLAAQRRVTGSDGEGRRARKNAQQVQSLHYCPMGIGGGRLLHSSSLFPPLFSSFFFPPVSHSPCFTAPNSKVIYKIRSVRRWACECVSVFCLKGVSHIPHQCWLQCSAHSLHNWYQICPIPNLLQPDEASAKNTALLVPLKTLFGWVCAEVSQKQKCCLQFCLLSHYQVKSNAGQKIAVTWNSELHKTLEQMLALK